MSAHPSSKPPRLRFIDMARAVAILLMLEGHFVGLVLGDEWRIKGNRIYEAWQYCRGLAAPMFFTVTGLIFAYLLAGAPADEPFLRIKRIRRGGLRVAELMFWGYALQFEPAYLTGDLAADANSRLLGFHVLQCIACGLLAMMAIYGLLRHLGAKVLVPAFLLCGFLLSLCGQILENVEGYWPPGAPALLQNYIKGPVSHFSLAPWLGFTLYGAAIGIGVRHHQRTKGGIINPAGFLIIGLALEKYGWLMDHILANRLLDLLGYDPATRHSKVFFHGRFGEILLLIGLLVCFDKWVKLKTTWFEIIGRNTFPIYVVHVILLYGGITGLGIIHFWERSLSAWQAAWGALVFMAAHAALAQTVAPIKTWWQSRWSRRRVREND